MSLAHRLSLRATIEQRSATRDASGQPIDVWTTVATVWAEVKNVSGREYFAAAATQSEVKTEIVIRARSGITSAMRINCAGRVYNIEAVLPQTDRRELLLICSSGVSNG